MKPLVGEVLQAARIAELREAVGVSPNPDRELTQDEQRLVAWFKEALQAEMEVQRAENDAMLNRLKAENNSMLDRLKAEAAKLDAEMQAVAPRSRRRCRGRARLHDALATRRGSSAW
jgi:hypothetical protein